jgi:hypothetical protein
LETLEDRPAVVQHVAVADANGGHAHIGENAIARLIVGRPIPMDIPVHLDSELEPRTVEVDDETTDDVLTPEAPAGERSASKLAPEARLARRGARPLLARKLPLRRKRWSMSASVSSSSSHAPPSTRDR